MSKGLKIYACTGLKRVGAVETPEQYDYWLDNTSSVTNTQAVNTMFTFINSAIIDLTYLQLTDEEKRARLRDIDLWAVALFYADKYKDNTEELWHAGREISRAKAAGVFDFEALDNTSRDAHLDAVFDQIAAALAKEEKGNADGEFMKWWEEYIVSRNRRGFTDEEAKRIQEILDKPISGLGAVNWQGNKQLAEYFNKAGEYFLYTYFTDEQLNELPYLFTKKAKMQRVTYKEAKSLFGAMNGSEDEMKGIIRSGIISEFGMQPEEVCDALYEKYQEEKRMGLATEAIITIVGLICSLLGAVIGAVVKICQAKAEKDKAQAAAVDEAAIQASVPYSEDFPANWAGGSSLSNTVNKLFSGAGVWIIAALGTGLLLFSGRRSKKHR